MKALLWLIAIVLLLIGGFYILNNYIYTEKQDDPMTFATTSPVTITPIEHATGILEWSDTVIYFDPTGGAEAFSDQPAAHIILVTDIHGDHLSTSTLAAVRGEALLIVPQAVHDRLPAELATSTIVLRNGEATEQRGLRIEATPMYNVPESDDAFHTKGRGNGYIVEKDGFRVLIAGDTANTPELRAMLDIDIALIPMNLPFTMSVEEAAQATLAFKPKTVYPYHYRGREGLSDVERFKQLVNAGDPSIEVVLANWYPNQ